MRLVIPTISDISPLVTQIINKILLAIFAPTLKNQILLTKCFCILESFAIQYSLFIELKCIYKTLLKQTLFIT